MENEGAVTTDAGSSSDLAATPPAESQPQPAAQDDPWSFADAPADKPAEPAAQLQPAEEKPVEAAADNAEPQPDGVAADQFANPFPKEDGRHSQWEGLRTHKDQLLAEVKQLKPLAEKVQALGDPAVIDLVAPLMQISEPGREAVDTARKVIDGIAGYDGMIGDAIAEAAYMRYGPAYFEWALADRGITPDAWKEFERFRADPAAFAPAGSFQAGGFPTPNADSNSPQFGLVTITAPDGSPVTLDVSDPSQNYTYQLAKKDWERDQSDARIKTEGDARAKQEQAKTLEQAEIKRTDDFTALCNQDLDAELESLNISVGDAPSSIPNLTEGDLAKLLTWGIARTWMDRDASHQKSFANGQNIARRGGAGRLESIRLGLKQGAHGHLERAKGIVEGLFRELNGYRQAVGKGALTSPRMPADAELIGAQPNAAERVIPSQQRVPDAYDEIWK